MNWDPARALCVRQEPVTTKATKIMDIADFYHEEFAEHLAVAEATQSALKTAFGQLLELSAETIRSDGKLMFFGNGGSASDAQHLATELTVRYKQNRPAIAAIALTTDTSALTAIGNDMGFEQLFSRQIEALGQPGDLAIGISTSGQSPNILRALETAASMKIRAVALSGGDGGQLHGLANPLLIIPSKTTARIQEMHVVLGQMLCGALEIELGLV